MREFSPAAQAFFASRAKGHRADLFTFALADGSIYRWTSLDRDVTYGGFTWLAQSPNIQRTSMNVRNTVQVPDLTLKLSAIDNDFAGGVNVKLAIFQSAFDGARVTYEMLPIPGEIDPRLPLDTSLGPPGVMFGGRIGEIELTATGATLKIRGDVVVMSQYAPRNLFQSSCQHRFCDSGCTLAASTFTTNNCDVATGSSVLVIRWGAVTPPDVQLAKLGTVTFTTGLNAGHKRSITWSDSGSFTLAYPLWRTPQPGDLFDLFQGCDKTKDMCVNTYNNRLHFRGFPSIPDASYAA